LAGIGMGEGVVVDALIAGVMCWALYRKKTGIARWDLSFNTYAIDLTFIRLQN
jgi:hypothetical protein